MARKTKTAAPTQTAPTTAAPSILIDPTWLKLGHNSRVYAETDEKQKDIERAISIATHGQKVPAILRSIPAVEGGADGEQYELVAGFGRLRSVNLLRGGFEHKGERYHVPDLQLLAQVDASLTSDVEAFIASAIENVRENPSPLNIAAAQKVLRDYGKSDTEIARLYGYNNVNSVSRHRKLLDTPAEVQQKVHAGELSLDAANTLMKLPEEQQKKLLESGDKLTTNAIVDAHSAWQERENRAAANGGGEGGGERPAEDKGVAPRNAAALKKFIAENIEAEKDALPPEVVAVFDGIQRFLAGSLGVQGLNGRIGKLIAAVK